MTVTSGALIVIGLVLSVIGGQIMLEGFSQGNGKISLDQTLTISTDFDAQDTKGLFNVQVIEFKDNTFYVRVLDPYDIEINSQKINEKSIEEKLKTIPETIGMNGDAQRGVVTIDHQSTLNGNTIAAAITTLGYPAKVVSTNKISAQEALATGAKSGTGKKILTGSGCNTRGPCNASSASWKNLYNRYVGKSKSQ